MTESFAELFEPELADKQMQPGSIVQDWWWKSGRTP